jgi:hypothetical protein
MLLRCKYCKEEILEERAELGYEWCLSPRCSSLGITETNKIVLVCGHKSGYQPMFREDVKVYATNPKRG